MIEQLVFVRDGGTPGLITDEESHILNTLLPKTSTPYVSRDSAQSYLPPQCHIDRSTEVRQETALEDQGSRLTTTKKFLLHVEIPTSRKRPSRESHVEDAPQHVKRINSGVCLELNQRLSSALPNVFERSKSEEQSDKAFDEFIVTRPVDGEPCEEPSTSAIPISLNTELSPLHIDKNLQQEVRLPTVQPNAKFDALQTTQLSHNTGQFARHKQPFNRVESITPSSSERNIEEVTATSKDPLSFAISQFNNEQLEDLPTHESGANSPIESIETEYTKPTSSQKTGTFRKTLFKLRRKSSDIFLTSC